MVDNSGAQYWDGEATHFDDEPDHGLRDPGTKDAWARLLSQLLPAAPARVADLGCGTGSLSVLLASAGHNVTGLDQSSEMLTRARAKADDIPLRLVQGDAGAPDLPAAAFDVVLSRHVVWALPDPRAALTRWTDLLVPGGSLVLVEGWWSTGGGLHAQELVDLLDERLTVTLVQPLDDPAFWGRDVDDERYVITARR